MSHTKTPWTQGDLGETFSRMYALDGSCIADCYGPDPLAFANAAHIVRCVNSHDKLVEALNRLARLCSCGGKITVGTDGSVTASYDSHKENCVKVIANDALALAQEVS